MAKKPKAAADEKELEKLRESIAQFRAGRFRDLDEVLDELEARYIKRPGAKGSKGNRRPG